MPRIGRRLGAVAWLALAGCGRTELLIDPPIEGDGAGAAGAGSSEPSSCRELSCAVNERCEPRTVTCACRPGFARATPGAACTPLASCEFDTDCDDGDGCNGEEACRAGRCEAGSPFTCPARQRCVSQANQPSCECAAGYFADAGGACLPACPVPLAPVISVIDAGETLHFEVDGDLPIQIAVQPAEAPASSAVYLPLADVQLAAHLGVTRVLARVAAPSCTPVEVFDAVYDVRETCAPPSGVPGSTAVRRDDPRLLGWATGVQSYEQGPGVTAKGFSDPRAALGSAQGNLDVVSLGDAGQLTLSFQPPIANGSAWDFVVFENAFNDAYLELGFVEVSSDGEHFLRFDSAFLGKGPASPGYAGDARSTCGLAGTYSAAFGTPFDLDALRNQPLARTKVVDLNAIRYVRVVDIVGDGSTLDSFGRPLFDPFPSTPSAGFDANGVGVLHRVEP